MWQGSHLFGGKQKNGYLRWYFFVICGKIVYFCLGLNLK
jgi:hypothetical protein